MHTKFNGRLAAAACGSRLDALALTNLHGRLVVDGSRTHALLDLSCHRQESLLYVGSVLGGSLEEGDSKAVGKLLQQEEMKPSVMSDKANFPSDSSSPSNR